MKYIFTVLPILLIIGCEKPIDGSGEDESTFWPLQNDSMNLAILVLDYQSYEFEGGNFSTHAPCENCDIDSLPFEILINDPADFGDVAFTYIQTGDTLFFATIIWRGQGQIIYPNEMLPADSFKVLQSDVPDPLTIEYFEFAGVEDSLEIKGSLAWEGVKELDITKDFSGYPYRVGIYLYTPTLGVFDPNPAKWIVFLYRGKAK